jgi:hypothetical protein
MYKIPIDPWKNMNLIYDSIMAGDGFSYLDKNFNNIYDKFIAEKEQILKNFEEGSDFERFIEVELYNYLFIILGCAMIELWVNSFGIHLLTEDYYHKNIERMGIVEKIKVLFAIHKREEIDDNNEIIKNIRKLFDWRNSLVHPKAKKLSRKTLIKENAFDPNNIDNCEYQFVKQTLQDVYCFFEVNEFIPKGINYLRIKIK